MRQALGEFIGRSVTGGTRRGYSLHWAQWCTFVEAIGGGNDPFMRGYRPGDKAPMLALFLKDRHGRGLRDKSATAASAGVRLEFTMALEASGFFDDPIVTATRGACRSTAAERREKKDGGPSCTVKLPLCESMVADRRGSNWTGRGWDYPDIDRRAVYLATTWAFDLGARISEYTAAEKGGEDHCVRAGDLTFDFETEDSSFLARGGEGHFELLRQGPAEGRAVGCWVRACTQKTGEWSKTKLIGRRSPSEAQLLDDLVEWITHAEIGPNDELFSRYATVRGRRSLNRFWPAQVRGEIKEICVGAGLDASYFSSHSLRKGGQTHMSALGVSLEDRRDRGNYTAASEMPTVTYDFSSAGHGALSANSLSGGVAPGVRDVQRYLPGAGTHLGELGGGGPH
jgi:hypothetical protein